MSAQTLKRNVGSSSTRIVLLSHHNYFMSSLYSLQQNCKTIGFHLLKRYQRLVSFLYKHPNKKRNFSDLCSQQFVSHAVFVLLFCAIPLLFWHASSSSIPTFLTLVLPSNHTQSVKAERYETESSISVQSENRNLKHNHWHPHRKRFCRQMETLTHFNEL